nr:gamma subclass chorismate mutase AroQ [Streptomyces sp. SID5468]
MCKPFRVLLATAALLAGAVAPAAADPHPAPPAGRTVSAPGHGALDPVVRLAARRVLVSDQVAAAKWGTSAPIDDPARERQVLDGAAAEAVRLGADPAVTRRIFRDQIEASKVVQRGLYRRWTADPRTVPPVRPDLAAVRAELNELGDRLVHAIAGTATARAARSCPAHLGLEYLEVGRELHLDALHRAALARALPSVCG